MPISDAPRTTAGYMSDHLGIGPTFADLQETVADLMWPASVQTYGKMRHDPQIAATLNAYTYPLRSGTWVVDPAGCRDEVVQMVSDDLGLMILGSNDPPGPARRRGIKWHQHLRMALLSLVWGHMPFAQRYDILGGRARLAELSERMPSTITNIDVAASGVLRGITQFGEDRAIPASTLVWYAHEREGAAWQGRSMLRPAYGPWLLKHEMWRVLATSSRRFGTGTPVVHAPPGATPGQIAEATRLSQSIRVGDQGGAGLPEGFRLELVGITGSVPDTLGYVRYLDSQIAQSVLASVLNLDASPNGSRALGETLVGLLEMSWAAVAEEVTDVATGLAVQMVDYNWGENEPAPRIAATEINRPEATAEAVSQLMAVGALTADPGIDAALRARYRLPQRVAELAGEVGQVDARALVEMVQKVYLGVGVVITAEEARGMLNAAGANLPMNVDPAPASPAPAQPVGAAQL